MRDAVIQEQSAGLQHAPHGIEIHGQILESHVLEHADARHLVVERLAFQVAIIAQLDRHPVLEPRRRDARARDLELLAAQRDSVGAHAVMLGRVDHQRAPAAADVEKSLTGLQEQLAADVLELGLLRMRRFQQRRARSNRRNKPWLGPARARRTRSIRRNGTESLRDFVLGMRSDRAAASVRTLACARGGGRARSPQVSVERSQFQGHEKRA